MCQLLPIGRCYTHTITASTLSKKVFNEENDKLQVATKEVQDIESRINSGEISKRGFDVEEFKNILKKETK